MVRSSHLEQSIYLTHFEVGTTLQDVHLKLAKDDAEAQASAASSDLPKLSLTGFFTTAFELEERQYVLFMLLY